MMAVMYVRETGQFVQNYLLTLKPPVTPELAVQADWDEALEALEEASGLGVIYGEARGNQMVVDGKLVTIDPTLQELKLKKTNELDAQRDLLEKAGFPYRGKLFQSDERSVARITVAVQAAQAAIGAGVPFEILWTTADNTQMPLDAVGMMGVPVALAQYAGELHTIGRELKALVRSPATDTKEKIDAIVWPEPTHNAT